MLEMPTSGDLKSGDSLFFTIPIPRVSTEPPLPRENCPSPQWDWLRTYEVLHEVHTIKIHAHCVDADRIFCQRETVRNRPTNKKNSHFEGKWATSQTKAQKRSKDDFILEIW